MTSREKTWNELYGTLGTILAQYGQSADYSKDAPLAEIGDYWIVDDDWGGCDQKICVISKNFPVEVAVRAIQELLEARFPGWRVFVVFDDNSQREGLLVYANRVETESASSDP